MKHSAILSLTLFFQLCLPVAASADVTADSIPEVQTLGEVIVNAQRKYVKSTSRGIKITMAGNPLSEIGSAVDAIKQMPLIDDAPGEISVIGKGNPIIYINGRRMQNRDELSMLTSQELSSVEIITNPPARYGSEVTAVILIRTKNRLAGMFGGVQANVSASEAMSENLAVNSGWTSESGITVFADVKADESRFKQKRFYNEQLSAGDIEYFSDTYAHVKNRTRSFILDGGMSYEHGNNSFGLKYTFSRQPSGRFFSDADTRTDMLIPENISSGTQLSSRDYRHYINLYGDFELPWKLHLRIDGDYVNGSSVSTSITDETEPERMIANRNRTYSRIAAGKIELSKVFSGLEVSAGADFTNTVSKQRFMSETNHDDGGVLLPATDDVRQNLFSVFASVDYSFTSKWKIYGGARYEAVDINYDRNHVYNPELSRNYRNLLSNIGVTYIDAVTASLYYRQNIYRPSYTTLDRNYSYVTPTLWEAGNPELREVLIHDLGLNISYRKFIFQASASRALHKIGLIYHHDAAIASNVCTFANLPAYNYLQFVAVQSLDVKFWHPTLQGILYLQDLKYGEPQRSYTTPLYRLSLRNRFDLPYKIQAYLSFNLFGSGNVEVQYCRPTWQAALTLSKSINNWTFTLAANDIFNSWRQKYITDTDDVCFTKNVKGASSYISLSVRYRFKTTPKSYKGKTVRADEIQRL